MSTGRGGHLQLGSASMLFICPKIDGASVFRCKGVATSMLPPRPSADPQGNGTNRLCPLPVKGERLDEHCTSVELETTPNWGIPKIFLPDGFGDWSGFRGHLSQNTQGIRSEW